MANLKRFFYIITPGGKVAHITLKNRRQEGDLLRCGRTMQKGWRWLTPRPLNIPLCKQCDAA